MSKNKKPVTPIKTAANDTVRKANTDKKTIATSSFSLFDSLENHFNNKQNIYLIASVILAAIFSYLCFDVKISLANDDALYIEAGAKYANAFFNHDSFYLANAPLYPMLLGLVIKVVGVKLITLKAFSVILFCAGIAIFFYAFRNRIPFIILIPTLLLTAINFPYLMYASLTYSECLYLVIIGISSYILLRSFEKIESTESFSQQSILPIIAIGFAGFLFLITRNIAVIAIVPIVLFLAYRKRFIEAGASIASFGVFYFLYKFAIKIIWKIDGSQYASQSGIIFNKNAYNPSLGKETFGGFITRLIENSQIYIGQRFMYILGFREEMSSAVGADGNITEYTSTNKLIALAFIGIVLASLYYMHKNKQYVLLFSTLFFSVLLGTTFVALQTSWGQTRLIMVYLPLILFSIFYLFYAIGKEFAFLQFLLPLVFVVLSFSSLSATLKQVQERYPVLQINMNEDPTYGYTTDWQNYIKMTKWCAKNLPNETKQIAVRKAPMSYIFSEGKEFYPIYSTPYQDADSLLTPFRLSKVNYIMPAKLRVVQDQYIEGQFISTVHRYMAFIAQKYGDRAFSYVHHEGEQEEAVLYKINWNYIDSIKPYLK